MKIILSKSQWEKIGKQTGWIKTAQNTEYLDAETAMDILENNFDQEMQNLEKSSEINILRGKELTTVAINSKKIVGALYEEFDGHDYSFDVIVSPTMRRQGIAKNLINIALNNFSMYEEMDANIKLDVVNKDLENYLKSIGFKTIDIIENHTIMTK